MFGWFKEKEPIPEWGDWRKFKQCGECKRLQNPFCGDFNNDVCPDCGSESIGVVVARWKEYWKSHGMIAERILTDNEIKI